MIKFPNAKINLGLNIIEKRTDGYHNLETVFYPIPLNDILEVAISPVNEEYRFFNTGIVVDSLPEDNICIKALKIIEERYDVPPVDIHLHKIIPFGAGLGGGSSNGATVINMVDALFELGISDDEKQKMAARLGADCAFFINGTPAFATGIGDVLAPVSLSLSGYYLVLVKPDIHVNTAQAYGGITPRKPEVGIADIITKPVAQWRNLLNNDFEDTIFKIFPQIGEIKNTLYRLGAVYASMSGSGSSVFALFTEMPEISFPGCFIWHSQL